MLSRGDAVVAGGSAGSARARYAARGLSRRQALGRRRRRRCERTGDPNPSSGSLQGPSSQRTRGRRDMEAECSGSSNEVSAYEEEQELLGDSRDESPKFAGTPGGARAMMLLVAALWGSYVPCLKVLYNMDGPPSIATYTAVHLTLSWIFLKLCQKVFFKITDENKDSESRGRSPWKDGAELAFWDTAAALLQVWGVTLTSAVHAGVIICLATGFVPILSWGIIKQKPKAAEIAGCTSALGGAVLLALDGTSVSATGELLSNGSIVGDGLTALSALFYAVSMVRIHQKTQGDSGREVSSTKLAVDKVFFAASFGWLWLLGELSYYHLFGAGSGTYRVWENILSPEQWILILFISVGPSALSNVLQFKALSRINPSEAQILLSTVPIWALSFSILTGGPTLLGGKALAGLMMICFSSLLTWLL